MDIWVDVTTGTWGDAKFIRVLSVDDHMLNVFDDEGDNWRIQYALSNGKTVEEFKASQDLQGL